MIVQIERPVSGSTIQEIVNTHCESLLQKMQAHLPSADVGISATLFCPEDPDAPSFYGYGSAGQGIEITPETVYAIGSVTKVFTASLAAYLNVRNVIDLRGRSARFLSNQVCEQSGVSGPYWDGFEGATFEQFATQTSGMPASAPGHPGDQLFRDELPSCRQLAWWNDEQESFLRDRGYWIYSNAGFVTLGFAVAAAAKEAGLADGYTSLLKEVITGPLDMPRTFAADDVPHGAALAQGHNREGEAVPITKESDLKSTARDLRNWLEAIYGALQLQGLGASMTSLQRALADTARTWIENPIRPGGKPTAFSMGLGWQIPTFETARGPVPVLTKNGSTGRGGCNCWVGLAQHSPSRPPVGFALMTNQIGVSPDSTARTILQEVLDLEMGR